MIIIIIIILIPIILFSLMDSYFGDRTNEYVTLKSQNVATKTITKVLDEYLLKDYEKNDIIEITYQNEGNNHLASIIQINAVEVNRQMKTIGLALEDIFLDEAKNIIEPLTLPLGSFFSRSFLARSGPKVKIPLEYVGTYKIEPKTSTTPYGINNCLFEVYLLITFDIKAFVPLQTKQIPCFGKIMLTSTIVQGEVPRYYFSSNGKEALPFVVGE